MAGEGAFARASSGSGSAAKRSVVSQATAESPPLGLGWESHRGRRSGDPRALPERGAVRSRRYQVGAKEASLACRSSRRPSREPGSPPLSAFRRGASLAPLGGSSPPPSQHPTSPDWAEAHLWSRGRWQPETDVPRNHRCRAPATQTRVHRRGIPVATWPPATSVDAAQPAWGSRDAPKTGLGLPASRLPPPRWPGRMRRRQPNLRSVRPATYVEPRQPRDSAPQ